MQKGFPSKSQSDRHHFFLLPYLRSGKVASSKILGGPIVYEIIGLPGTTEGISKKKRLREQDVLFRTVLKIS